MCRYHSYGSFWRWFWAFFFYLTNCSIHFCRMISFHCVTFHLLHCKGHLINIEKASALSFFHHFFRMLLHNHRNVCQIYGKYVCFWTNLWEKVSYCLMIFMIVNWKENPSKFKIENQWFHIETVFFFRTNKWRINLRIMSSNKLIFPFGRWPTPHGASIRLKTTNTKFCKHVRIDETFGLKLV